MSLIEKIKTLVVPAIEGAGYVLVNVAFGVEFEAKALVVTIDKPDKEGGVSVEDCKTVAKLINPMLDEADLIPDRYMFIVTSPGVKDEDGDND